MNKGNKKILTVEQLVKLFESNNIQSFNYKDTGYKLSAQMPAKLIYENSSDSKNLYATVKVCHTLLNRNGSFISEENMKKAMPSLKEYTPLLGYIHQLNDGTYDFHGHDFDIVEDENGDERVVYKEQQIGTFTVDDPYLEYDEAMDKTYVVAKVAIPKEYTLAADIIQSKGGTKVSCELEISSCAFNAKEKYLELQDFLFLGCTCLGSEKDGTEIGEGMIGSRLDIEDFSVANNSVCSNLEINKKLINSLDRLNDTLSQCFNNKDQKGGMESMTLEELLAKYSKTVEELDFDYQNMTNEELEAKFAELFEVAEGTEDTSTDEAGDNPSEDTPSEDSVVVEDDQSAEGANDEVAEENIEEPVEVVNDDESSKKKSYSVVMRELENGNKEIVYEISHEDVRYALYNLLSQFEELDNDWYDITNVYDDYFVMHGWFNDAYYGCKYAKDDDVVSLVGERWALHVEFLTDSEKANLDNMRANYSTVVEKLSAYEKAEDDANKSAIFEDAAYKAYLNEKEFVDLIDHKDEFTVAELQDKAELAFAKCVKKNASFASKEQNTSVRRGLFVKANSNTKRSPYGNIFKDK